MIQLEQGDLRVLSKISWKCWLLSMDIRWAFDGGLHDIVLIVLRRLHPKAYESRELHDAKASMGALVLQLPFSTVLEER